MFDRGTWLYFSNLPVETTDESLRGFLYYTIGLDVSVNDVALQRFTSSCNAIVSVTPAASADFVDFCLRDEYFNGKPVRCCAFADRKKTSTA